MKQEFYVFYIVIFFLDLWRFAAAKWLKIAKYSMQIVF